MELTDVARLALALLDQAEKHGIDRGALVREANLREEDLADPDSRIPASTVVELWRGIAAGSTDPAIGLHIGSSLGLRELGLVGYTMAYSGTLGRVLQRLTRYSRIISEVVRCSLEREGEHTKLRLDGERRLDALRHPADCRLATVLHGARQATRAEIVPVEVHFGYDRPADASKHADFFRCPLRFGRREAALVLRVRDLQRPVTSADEALCGYLDRVAEEVLQSLGGRSSFTDQVHRAIWTELSGGPPTLHQTADLLGVSARTLQRRLREEGTTFAVLLGALRREMASQLLRRPELAIYEVAFLLGYAEPSTFYRAFRRWHGASPQEFRRSTD
jgi:AraC-like DNA-binding protein